MDWRDILNLYQFIGILLLLAVALYALFAAVKRRLRFAKKSPNNVVITGGTRGLGKALVVEFAKRGNAVFFCGRDENSVKEVVKELNEKYPSKVSGVACDVSDPNQVHAFAVAAKKALGNIDVWINNAGITSQKKPLMDMDAKEYSQVINTNLLGTLHGCKEAIKIMMEQESGGHVFLMEGTGSSQNTTPNNSAYGSSKSAIRQLGKTLAAEMKEHKKIGIHRISPGMFITDLLLTGNKTQSALGIFNLLAERPSTVANFIVNEVSIVTAQQCTGKFIQYLTKLSVVWRFATFWKRRGRFFDAQGRLRVENADKDK